MILVFGATGHIGGALISILSSQGVSAVAVARAPERARPLPGIRWAKADLAEPASINGVFGGVNTMFLLTGNGPDLATLQVTAIRTAVKSGVEYVVKLSALAASSHSKSPIGRAHYEAEQALIGSGMRWAILASSRWRPTSVQEDRRPSSMTRCRKSLHDRHDPLAEFVKDHAKDFRGDEGTPEEDQ